tara:strand:- start:404 stop:580 length:177 start_codon:yes stop_codon:yes gene_type:complete
MKKVAESKVEGSKEIPNPQPTEMVMSLELAQEIANYLGSRPYNEVAELIKGLQGSKVQ